MRSFDTLHNRSIRMIMHLMLLMAAIVLSGTLPAASALAAGGDILWQRQDAQAGKQEARRSVVDSTGSVIITGYRNLTGNPDDDDYWTVKFTADGSGIVWSKPLDKSGGTDQANAIAVDEDDNIIVTGHVMSGTNKDIHTVKYNGVTGAVIWQHTYNGDGNGVDSGLSVTIDENNNVFVAGYSQNLAGNLDYIVLRYPYLTEPGSNQPNWSATYGYDPPGAPLPGDDIAESVAARDGKVAITGRSWNGTDYDMLTVRYDIVGETSWEQRYATAATGSSKDDRALEVRLDQSGNAVITGITANALDKDIYTAKYEAATGALLWERIFNGSYDDEPAGLAIDATGTVYITGYTWTLAAKHDFYTASYNGNTGAVLWEKNFNSSNGNDDIASATGIVVDEANGVFVTGYTISNGNDSYQTVKYRKSDGTELWHVLHDVSTGRNDRSVGIGLDPAGAVLVAGWTDAATTGIDYHIVKYDPDLLNSPTGLQTQVAVDNSSVTLTWAYTGTLHTGFVVQRCEGWECTNFADVTTTPLPPADRSWVDTAVVPDTIYYYRVTAIKETEPANTSYPSNTARALTQYVAFVPSPPRYDFNSEFAGDDLAKGIAVGPDNNPVVTGYSDSREMSVIPGSGGGLDYLTMKFDRSLVGQPLWSSRYDSMQNGIDIPACIAVNSSNEILIAGLSELYYAPAGGNINSVYTVKYPAAGGEFLWSDQFNGPGGIDDRATAIASSLDANNNIAVVGYGKNAQNNNDIYLIKYTSAGVRAWAPKIINKYGYEDLPSAVAFDSSGNIFITGTIHNGTNFDIYTAKYNGTTGALIWDDIYPGTANGDDQGLALAVDPAGNPYVTGYVTTATGRDFYTIKYDGVTKSKIWERSYNGPANGNDWGVAIAVDPFDGSTVTVAGTSRTRNADNDFRIIRYAANGDTVWATTILRPDSDEELKSMVTDLSGNIVVAGTSTDWVTTSALAYRIKHDGTLLDGTSVASLSGTIAEASSVAVNLYGEAFVAGYSENATLNADYLVFKMPGATNLQPPTTLTTAPATTSVTLAWYDNSLAEDGYKVYRKAEACSANSLSFTELANLTGSRTGYIDTTITPATTYCYRVLAYVGTTDSRYSQTGTLTTPATPEPLTLLTNADQTQITLTWGNVTGETGYSVERKVGTAGSWATLTTKGADLVTHADTGLTAATVYYYRVKATNASGSSPFTAVQSLPARPVLAAAVASSTQINLTWTDLETETGYVLERKTGAGAWEPLDTPAAGSNSYNNTGLLSGTLYTYRLKAQNASGISAWSADAPATTPLQAPSLASVTVSSTTQVALTWTDPNSAPNANETGYQASYALCTGTAPDECTDPNAAYWGGWTTVTAFAANATSGNVTGLTAGRTYKFRMQGLLTGANSAYSNTVIVTLNLATPAAPTLGTISNNSVVLTWADIAGETNYDVIKDGVRIYLALPKNTTTTTITGLTQNTTYSFQVYAYNSTSNATSLATPAKTTVNPTTLSSVTALSATAIKLIWADATGESGYEIQRATLNNQEENPASPPTGWGAWTTLTTVPNPLPADTIEYTDSGLSAGYTYKYRVRYKLPDNSFSAYSNELYATTVPPTPTFSSVANGVINWTNVPGETGYSLYQKQRVGADCATEDWTGVTPTSLGATTYNFSPTGLVAGTTYCYRIQASNAVGSSPVSAPITYLLAPTGVTLTGITQSSITVNWGNVTGNTGYTLQWSTSSTFASVSGSYAAAANVTSYTVTGLNSGTTYYFRVQSKWSTSSTSFWSTTVSSITIPATPTGLTATPVGVTQINLTWTGSVGASGYKIQYKPKLATDDCSLESFWSGATQTSNTIPSGSLTPLIKGTPYCIRVNAYDSSGDSPYSTPVTQTTLLDVPALAVITSANVTASSVCLSWTNVNFNDGYRVERSLDNTTWPTTFSTLKDVVTYCDTSVLAGTLYYYRVSPKNAAGGYSTASSVQSTTTTPAAPATFTAAVISNTRVDLAWSSSLSASKYRLERKEGSGAWGLVGTEQNIFAVTDTGLKAGTTYTYRVLAWNATGLYSVPSVERTVTTLTVGSIAISSLTPENPTRVVVNWSYDGSVCSPASCALPEGYEIEMKLATGRWSRIGTVAQPDATSFTDACGLRPDKTYYYRVRSYRGAERSPYSNDNGQSVTTLQYSLESCSYTPGGQAHPPAIISIPPTAASQGTAYSYQLTVSDAYAGDTFIYTLLTAPSGMTISPTGLISWTPAFTQDGDKQVLVRVSDIVGNTTEQSYTIAVAEVNMAPAISSAPVTTGIDFHPYSYQVVANDLNADPITYTLPVAPAGMTINSAGLIAWTPTTVQIGANNVTVRVSDGTASSDQIFTVTVAANGAPAFTSTPVATGSTAAAYSYQTVTTDPENDARSYSLTTGPSGMSVNSSTGLVSWASPVSGSHPVTVSVSDGQNTVQQTYTLVIS